MTAIGLSLVACPVVSAGALAHMRTLATEDYCDNVLLEWMTMLALRDHVHAHGDDPAQVRLRRIVPLFLGSAWLNSNSTSASSDSGSGLAGEGSTGDGGGDSFGAIRDVAMTLPDVVSKETAASLDQYFAQVLHAPPPSKHRSVREAVLALFDIDAVVGVGTQGGGDSSRAVQLRSHADTVRKVVANAREEHAENGGGSDGGDEDIDGRGRGRGKAGGSSQRATGDAEQAPRGAAAAKQGQQGARHTSSGGPPRGFAMNRDLEQWLAELDVLEDVYDAFAQLGIKTFDMLELLVEAGDVTAASLQGQGVAVAPARLVVQRANQRRRAARGAAPKPRVCMLI
ncbi:hypothetical protein PTSG_01764 [Salpingoeca rosetta]|uniref:SAM domain-containing protein n=1 Tax=Salpingoeca rosetta (strain ATCC 50818 / BSB-021) TaxID=946362 RepID=F2TYW4_SALR5|nr:uncharacterized protein PTSG_01764 [Salpingoeca rosetta]EGD78788.1 hypothetical protein PTSG_01764 [Salpingoeca rosetta]|eukprot:XP_004997744.1 hypothetical protein PTSG_01764 [Salpingoeca rosetta]